MLKTASKRYVDNFKGFSREIWILAIITFINRAGPNISRKICISVTAKSAGLWSVLDSDQ